MTKLRYRGNTLELLQAAREMRTGSTSAEEVLWEALRDRRLRGIEFRRQHSSAASSSTSTAQPRDW